MDLRPLTLGSLEQMERLQCSFLDGKDDINAVIEFAACHSIDPAVLESMTIGEFKASVRALKYSLPVSTFKELTDHIASQTAAVKDKQFTPANQKKKGVWGTVRAVLLKACGLLQGRRVGA